MDWLQDHEHDNIILKLKPLARGVYCKNIENLINAIEIQSQTDKLCFTVHDSSISHWSS